MRLLVPALLSVLAASCSSPRSSDTPRPTVEQPALAAGTVRHFTPIGTPQAATSAATKQPRVQQQAQLGHLSLRLSERDKNVAPASPATSTRAVTLSQAEAQRVLARLPPLRPARSDKRATALRDGPKPPSRSHLTTSNGFVPTALSAPTNAPKHGLTVLRYAPEGKVVRTGGISVTFSQPMRALTSHKTLSATDVPVRVTPAIKGTWRWIDTRTLILEPAAKLPRSTRYTIEIPKGTAAVTGQRLARPVRWQFQTPTPTLVSHRPNHGPQPRDPTFIIGFDQPIDPAAVVRTLKLRRGTQSHGLTLVPIADLAARNLAPGAYEYLKKGTWLAAKSTKLLDTAASYEMTIGPGTPSAQGPLVTTKRQSFKFRTFGPLTLNKHQCMNWCGPNSSFSMTFSNPLDAASARSAIRIRPRIKDLKIDTSGGQWTLITGTKKAKRTYTITLGANLKDKFGNRLGKRRVLSFTTNPKRWYGTTLKGKNHVVLDPAGTAAYSFLSIKHKALVVKVYAVDPTHHRGFIDRLPRFYRNHEGHYDYNYAFRRSGASTAPTPGRLVMTKTIRVRNPDILAVHSVDLRRALKGGLGHAIVEITPTKPLRRNSSKAGILAWVQSTKIGLSALSDQDGTIVMATRLRTGAPMKNIDVSLLSAPGTTLKTGSDGVVHMPANKRADGTFLLARAGNDTAILPWRGKYQWRFGASSRQLLWYVFDDRQLYRPGETVHLKGWIRSLRRDKGGDVQLSGMAGKRVDFKVRDAQGVELARGARFLNGLDGFDLSFRLPKDVNLGSVRISMSLPRQRGTTRRSHSHSIKVQEFRRPEFVVKTTAGGGDHVVGTKTTATVRAAYYTGGALGGAKVQWRVSASPATYTPPNQSAFYFDIEEPWWHHRIYHGYRGRNHAPSMRFKGTTNSRGEHTLQIALQSLSEPRTTVVRAEASVADINRQAWTDGAQFIVHPSSLHVGIRARSRFLDPGTLSVESIVTDVAGTPVPGNKVQITAVPLGGSSTAPAKKTTCTTVSQAAATRCTVDVTLPGIHRITATVLDAKNRPHKTEFHVWVSGGTLPGERNLAADRVVLTPDRKRYIPGETAKVLVRAPFFPAEALMTVSRNGVLSRRRFHMSSQTATVDVPLTMSHAPSAHIEVSLVGSAAKPSGKSAAVFPRPPRRPAHARGLVRLEVAPTERILSVKVKPAAPALEPGAKTAVHVQVLDSKGRPVQNAEVSVIAVDESVLALGNYRIPDPVQSVFYNRNNHSSGVTRDELRQWIVFETAAQLRKKAAQKSSPVVAESGSGRGRRSLGTRGRTSARSAGAAIAVRKNFSPLAVFAPAVSTNANGIARISFKLPDNLTRYRVTAVVAAGKNRFGTGESSITARRELMVRPSPPRFLSYGDRFELPVVVQNLSARALDVKLAARATNLRLTDTWGWSFSVPAGKRVEVRFPAATRSAGTARLQIVGVASAGKLSDAAELSFPVWTPATSEGFAVYGHLDKGGVVQPVLPPADVIGSIGGLDVTTSTTALHSLQDAISYLLHYPYDGSEQLASRIMALAALADLLPMFTSKTGPTAAQMKARVQRDIKTLTSRQRYDGGFRLWPSHHHNHPFVSAHAAHALFRAKNKGFAVPRRVLQRAARYLRRIRDKFPRDYDPRVRHAIESYATFALTLSGAKSDLEHAKTAARRLAVTPGPNKVSLESNAWLMSVLATDSEARTSVAAMHRHLLNRVTETASDARFTSDYATGGHLLMHSQRRTDAVVLDALIAARPKAPLIGKVVAGLMAKRVKGRWIGSQENAFVLIALARYFNTFESTPPDLVASVWLGRRYAGAQAFRGRTTGRHTVHVPMRDLLRSPLHTKSAQDLVVQRTGAGRLYYRLGLRYAPKSLTLAASSHGFSVERTYEGVDNPADAMRAKDGAWKLRAGARIRVRLSMVAPARRYNLVLVDHMPAGLEAVNPALATTARINASPLEQSTGWRWWSHWFDHQNLRDERVEVFASNLRAGVYGYSYIARATTPGIFTAAPAKAEELYNPETFGRSATDRVIVE